MEKRGREGQEKRKKRKDKEKKREEKERQSINPQLDLSSNKTKEEQNRAIFNKTTAVRHISIIIIISDLKC